MGERVRGRARDIRQRADLCAHLSKIASVRPGDKLAHVLPVSYGSGYREREAQGSAGPDHQCGLPEAGHPGQPSTKSEGCHERDSGRALVSVIPAPSAQAPSHTTRGIGRR
jgi:hypothetical protein